jgi:hypothetical protein
MFAYTKIMQAMSGAVAVVTDAYFNLVTLLLNTTATNGAQNNTFLDSSTNNFTITRNGNTTQGTFTPFSQTGWSNYFNGSSDYASAGTSLFNYTTANASTQTATIEAWVYTTAYGSPSQPYYSECIIGKGDVYMNFGINGSGNLVLAHFDGSQRSVTSSATVPLNTWTYVACTISGGVVTLYINGSSSGTGTWYGIAAGGQNSVSQIARVSTDASSIYFSGYLSNIRVSTNVRTISTPTTAYSSDGNTALLTCQSNRFVDNSSNAYALTLTGTPSVQAFSPFAPTAAYDTSVVGGSGYFDGTGDYLTVPASTNLSLGSSDFTIELWWYPTGFSADGEIFSMSSSGGASRCYSMYTTSSNGKLEAYAGSGGGSWDIINALNMGTYVRNQWNHIAFTRSGSTFNTYLNGVRISTTTSSGTLGSANLGIGANNAGGGVIPASYMSARTIKGTALYTGSTYTVPTTPFTAVTNTNLLLNFTNAGIFDSAAKNDLETVGNAQVSTTQAKFGTTSMYFDGSGDGLIGPVSNLFDFGSGDFCVEFWANIPSTSGTGYFVSVWEDAGGSDANSSWLIRLNNNGTLITHLTQGSSTFNTLASGTLSTNTWFHCAYTRSGNTIYLFIDGVLAQSASVSGAMNTVVRALRVGYQSGGSVLTGYLDDLRITKGYARYTANFTPPAAAFPLQ